MSVVGSGGAAAYAAFSATTSNAGNQFTAAASFDRQFYFAKTTDNTGTNCGLAGTRRDMLEGYGGQDPAERIAKDIGEPVSFCSPTFNAGDALAAGTAKVNGYIENTSGSTCGVTATLYKNGTTSLGSASLTIAPSALTLQTWSISTAGTSFASGDRLIVHMQWGAEKACKNAYLYWGDTTNRSHLELAG